MCDTLGVLDSHFHLVVYVIATNKVTPQSAHLETLKVEASVWTNSGVGHRKELGWERDQKEPFSSEDF